MKRATADKKSKGSSKRTEYHLNTQQAADYIGVSFSLLQQARIAKGKKSKMTKMKSPNFVKLGRLVRYSIDDLDQWIQERRKKA